MLTLAEAFEELAKLTAPGKTYSTAQLSALAAQVTLDVAPTYTQGSNTLLYSGTLKGVQSKDYIKRLIDDGADIRVIDKTQAGRFMASEAFEQAFLKFSDSKTLYHPTDGPWAAASKRFVADTVGPVRFLGPGSIFGRQFGSTELKHILEGNTGVTHIDGIQVSELRRLNLEDAYRAVSVRSAEVAAASGFKVIATNGTLQSVDLGDFLKSEALNVEEYVRNKPEAIERLRSFVSEGVSDYEKANLKAAALGVVRKLGTAGSLLLLSLAVHAATEASEAGDTEGARKIMEQWALEAAGSGAGASVGATVVGLAAAAAAVAGVAVSAPVVTVLVLAGAVVGGIYGSSAATRAWEQHRGSADEGETNLLERLAALVALPDYHVVFGSANADALSGTSAKDYLFGGAGDDTLDGGSGDDVLRGGKGNDSYQFSGAWGKDVVTDSDGQGTIQIDGQTVGSAKASGRYWIAKLDNGQFVGIAVYNDSSSSTGKKAVLTRAGSTADTITINNFDLARAYAGGYLGIQLENNAKLALQDAAAYFWGNPGADPATLTGQGSSIVEGGGGSFAVSLNKPAKAGESVTVSLQGLEGKGVKAVINGQKVDANGATITLQEGQTIVSFTLVQTSSLSADANGSLSVTYNDGDQTATSNIWGLTLKDSGEVSTTLNGDYTKRVNGASYVVEDNGNYANDGPQLNAQDVLNGSTDADQINGLGGNDGIAGFDGDDVIDGGAGDDLLLGGRGSDKINGGDGNDEILGSATGGVWRPGVTNFTPPPATGTEIARGFSWVIYHPSGSGSYLIEGAGIDPLDESTGNVIDGGAGNDRIGAGSGADLVHGGEGDDGIFGMGGADVLLGEAGVDWIEGDGRQGANGWYTAFAAQGDDFIDGGAGNDFLVGQGGADQIFGGDDDDRMLGDQQDHAQTLAESHGEDYLDGEGGGWWSGGCAISALVGHIRCDSTPKRRLLQCARGERQGSAPKGLRRATRRSSSLTQ